MNLATSDPDNATDADTIEAQTALKTAGYYKRNIDDDFGPNSRQALEDYRRDHPNLTAPVPATPVAGLTHLQQLILDCLAQYVGLQLNLGASPASSATTIRFTMSHVVRENRPETPPVLLRGVRGVAAGYNIATIV